MLDNLAKKINVKIVKEVRVNHGGRNIVRNHKNINQIAKIKNLKESEFKLLS